MRWTTAVCKRLKVSDRPLCFTGDRTVEIGAVTIGVHLSGLPMTMLIAFTIIIVAIARANRPPLNSFLVWYTATRYTLYFHEHEHGRRLDTFDIRCAARDLGNRRAGCAGSRLTNGCAYPLGPILAICH